MTKIKYFTTLTLSLMFFFSCTDKDDHLVMENNNLVVEEIIDVTKGYVANQRDLKLIDGSESSSRLPHWLEVAISDVIGGAVGNLVGGPVGGVILGVGASVAAGVGIAAPPNDGGVDNANNTFDYAGAYHVDILHNCITEQNEFVYTNGAIDFDNYKEVADNILISKGLISSPTNFSINDFNGVQSYISTARAAANDVLSVVFANMEQDGLLSIAESNILSSYFYAFEQSSAFAQFLAYSISVENTVANSSLSTDSKEKILFTMSTARHDLNYWRNSQ